MAFNVLDNEGNHLGVVVESFMNSGFNLLVALTEEQVEEEKINYSSIKAFLAGVFCCKSILGKINEEKFEDVLSKEYKQKFSHIENISYEQLIKCCLLSNLEYKDNTFLEKLAGFKLNKELIKGYVLYDITKAKILNNSLIIEQDISYIYEEKMQKGVPLYGAITDLPEISVEILGFGGPGGLAGQNHLHKTRIKLLSGNAEADIDIPLFIPVRKGESIQIYYYLKQIQNVLYQGAVYKHI